MKIFSKFNFYFLLVLIIFIPFQNFIGSFLALHSNLSVSSLFWLLHWYEPIAIISLIISLVCCKPKIDAINIIAIVLSLFAIVLIFIDPYGISRGLEGFRLTFFYLLVFLLVYNLKFDKQEFKIFTNFYLVIASIIAVWAIIERFLPNFYWSTWNIAEKSFGFGNFNAVNYQRSASLIGAPNQLGIYLIPAFFLLINKIKPFHVHRLPAGRQGSTFNYLHSTIYLLLSTLMAVAIFLTFSRSAILGLVFAFICYLVWKIRNVKLKIVVVLLIAVLLSTFYFLLNSNSSLSDSLLNHGGSQATHQIALNQAFDTFRNRDLVEKLFGGGLGTDGPIVMKYGGLASECWYLQLILESGIVGLLLWLSLVGVVVLKLFKKGSSLALGWIGVMVAAIFLHPFADNLPMTYTLFVLSGVILNVPSLISRHSREPHALATVEIKPEPFIKIKE